MRPAAGPNVHASLSTMLLFRQMQRRQKSGLNRILRYGAMTRRLQTGDISDEKKGEASAGDPRVYSCGQPCTLLLAIEAQITILVFYFNGGHAHYSTIRVLPFETLLDILCGYRGYCRSVGPSGG